RTFVPLRFIMEAMEAEVEYESSTGQVIITR
ncbi:MAG: copper amine oxidase N-terminal domain-containing protein, partial [Syntrophomonadaceae bacterium]|nr:copper amine oxidase N-terminal domain-containing protein [Syntrophomonadaceae bacterium]